MKTISIAAFALNAALYVAAGILFYSVLPISFGPVKFWPQAVIPAIFAIAFGPWVGGLGAGLGIFLNDIILGGNPLLSLMAGVTANFAGFWLVGYLAKRKVSWPKSIVGYGIVTAGLMAIAYFYTDIMYVWLVAISYIIFVGVALAMRKYIKREWQSLQVAMVTGLLVGSAIIGLMVPVYYQYFVPGAAQLTLAAGLAYFIWTFTTEIPFMLLLGTPITAVIYKAFPAIKPKEEPRQPK
jgi:uncharacterized membrane protein